MAGNTLTDAAAAVASGSARGPVVPEPHTSPAGRTAFAGVALLTLAAPFELTEPLLRLPRQSVSSLEMALLLAFAGWGAALVFSGFVAEWRTPLTPPWIALLLAMLVASAASPVSRVNALHMTGRLGAAFGVYFLTLNGVSTRARLRTMLALALAVGVVVSGLMILEYIGVRPVLAWLRLFRRDVATVGAQVRAGGPLQYPTIASMYLEVVFALGLGVLLGELDRSAQPEVRTEKPEGTTPFKTASKASPARTCFISSERGFRRCAGVAAVFVALVVIGEAITLTFTRAGLVTMALSLALVGAIRRTRRGTESGGALIACLALVIAALFLVSRSPRSMWLRFTSEGQESWYRAKVGAPPDLDLPTGRTTAVPVKVTNTGRLLWDSRADPPVLLSYHWLPAEGDHFVSFEGVRTPFASPVAPDTTVSMRAVVGAPLRPGRYRLEWDIVQEGRLWFSTEPGAIRSISRATVTANAPWSGVEPAIIPPPRATVRPGRFALWSAAGRMFAAHPLLGVGPDNFRLSYGAYAGLATADARTHSNNMYLEVLAGGGLLGGAAFVWLLWRAAGSFAAVMRLAPDAAGGAALGLGAAGLAIGLHAAVDSFLSFAPTYVLFSLTLGCASACVRDAEARPDANRV